MGGSKVKQEKEMKCEVYERNSGKGERGVLPYWTILKVVPYMLLKSTSKSGGTEGRVHR